LGDQIDMIGAIRYIAQFHSEMHVPCFSQNYNTLVQFFSDEPRIRPILIDNAWYNKNRSEWREGIPQEAIAFDPRDYMAVYRSGYLAYPHHDMHPDYVIPICFYNDLRIDPQIQHTYFKIPENAESKRLYETIKHIRYIFTQQKSSSHFSSLITWDRNETLTIDPNVNVYPSGHPWHALAQTFVNAPFPHYTDTIIHAAELHVTNSAFRCLAAHLPLKATVKKCYQRETGEHIPEWTFNWHNPTSPSQ
jgi:hypothetical protein